MRIVLTHAQGNTDYFTASGFARTLQGSLDFKVIHGDTFSHIAVTHKGSGMSLVKSCAKDAWDAALKWVAEHIAHRGFTSHNSALGALHRLPKPA